MRLNRYIASCGIASRRKAEVLILERRISVNGCVAEHPAQEIDLDADTVTLDGSPLLYTGNKRYFVMNKPMGVLVSARDTHGRSTVYDIFKEDMRGIFPAGRLDADTIGVLIFTDDGDLSFRLTHPSYGVDKVYAAEIAGKITDDDVKKIRGGLTLEDGPTAPAHLKIIERGDDSSFVELTIHQGRKRQVRRMFQHIGHPVKSLERLSFGGITARGLPLGAYRPLEQDEIDLLKKTVGLR